MISNVTEVTVDAIVNEVMKMKNDGYRLVTFSTYAVGEKELGIMYHFDKDLAEAHLRLIVDKEKPIPSVSGVYFCAMLVENEIQDQWNVKFDGLVVDFNRTLLLDSEVTTVPLVNNVKIEPKN